MVQRIHDDEIDTSEGVVRALVADQLPARADDALTPLANSGTTNALWRVRGRGEDLVVRLPRMPSGASSIDTEVALLPRLAATALAEVVRVPELAHAGAPTTDYPLPWMAVTWIEGTDLWDGRHSPVATSTDLVDDVAQVVATIGGLDDLPAPDRGSGHRGGPLAALIERLHRWLDDPTWSASAFVDVAAVRRHAAAATDLVDDEIPRSFVHGDLIPGNLLTLDDRLSAVIDWGGAGFGDPAQDLAPAWALFDRAQRDRFRETSGADEATWIRARTIELEHALGGVLYYVPRRHALGDVMARTLDRILAEPA